MFLSSLPAPSALDNEQRMTRIQGIYIAAPILLWERRTASFFDLPTMGGDVLVPQLDTDPQFCFSIRSQVNPPGILLKKSKR